MARHNRVSLPEFSYYAINTSTVNGDKLFADPSFKDEIVAWLHGIAAFSGIELLAWCVMDNQYRLVIRVPDVPEHYWTHKEIKPAAYAFGMRPVEKRKPLYLPEEYSAPSGKPSPTAPRPVEMQVPSHLSDTHSSPFGKPFPTAPRPNVDFMLTDEQMFERLGQLYSYNKKKVAEYRTRWFDLRKNGHDDIVLAEKEAFCLRMYNVTQFVKSFNERIARVVNARQKRKGPVFAGRFVSNPMENDSEVLRTKVFDVCYEPYRTGAASPGFHYEWSSFAEADGIGMYSESCRAALMSVWGKSWEETCDLMWSDIKDEIPDPDSLIAEVLVNGKKISPMQLVRLDIPQFRNLHYFGRSREFMEHVRESLPEKFPRPTFRHYRAMLKVVDWPPLHAS